jgi:hypothetical protein
MTAAIAFIVIVIALFLAAHYGALALSDRHEVPMTPLERAILEQLSDQPR